MTTKQTKVSGLKEKSLILLDYIQDPQRIQWIVERRKLLFFLFFAILLSIVFISKQAKKAFSTDESRYLVADNLIVELNRSMLTPSNSQETNQELEKLIQMTKESPRLASRYAGTIAQTLLYMGRTQEALPFAQQTLKRTEKIQNPAFTDFSKINLLIGNQTDSKALEESKLLKNKMLENSTLFDAPLFAYNLLQIAMLEQKNGSIEGEKAAWQEWNNYAKADKPEGVAKAAQRLAEKFKQGDFSLNQYIAERKKTLS